MSESETLADFVSRYANTVGRYGPDSPEARAVRATATIAEWLQYADALDRVKRHLGGKGMVPKP